MRHSGLSLISNLKSTRPKNPRQAAALASKSPRGGSSEKLSSDSLVVAVVGVGASAGGLEAFIQLLKHLPTHTGMGFVLVQHLDPTHESALASLLTRVTSMPVREVTNNLRVQANHVYIIPPKVQMAIEGGVLKLSAREGRGPARSIDFFFESLAQDQRDRAIGVILSGTATDGTMGLQDIKAEGGITFAQDESAKYDSMPRSAIAAQCVDFVLSPEKIAQELARIARHPYVLNHPVIPAETERQTAIEGENRETPLPSGRHGTPPTGARQAQSEAQSNRPTRPEENGFKSILLMLRNHSGVDFSLYKSSTIQRRVTRRVVLNKLDSLEQYAPFLKGNAKELDSLYSDVLISVTSFFRNPEAFDALKRTVFPKLLQKRRDDPVRVWVVGCSTGQEAYSIAMSFAEFSENLPRVPKLQIFATDLNDALLDKARHGLYAKTLEQDISHERLRRFFVEEDAGYRVSKNIREQVVFARQNVLNDPPFSRMDLISCRNVLIYLEPGLQKRIIPAFHYALKPGGFLFLGASEAVGHFTQFFEFADKKQKIFAKKTDATPTAHVPISKERMPLRPPRVRQYATMPRGQDLPEESRGELGAQREADRLSVNRFAPPGILIDAELKVIQFRGSTSPFLEPPTGKASFDVFKMAREGLMMPLRAAINKAKREHKPARRENIRIHENNQPRSVNFEVIPLKNLKQRFYLVLFELAASKKGKLAPPTVPAPKPLGKRQESRRIASLELELAETRDYLQSLQEQSEASNEELQASNEEVQSSNEELQSINEELETSKEELESSNEELTTINEEMANRNTELTRLTGDLNNLHLSISTAILLLTRDLSVRRFTPQAEKLFNLMVSDIGRPLSGIKHNLEFQKLEELVREVIDTVQMQEHEVRSKDGRWYLLRVRPYMTPDNKIDGAVLVLVEIDALKCSEEEAKVAREYAQATLRTVRDPLVILRPDFTVESANDAFYKTFKVKLDETENVLIYQLGSGQWEIVQLRQLLENIIPKNTNFNDLEVTYDFPHIGRRTMLLNARRMDNPEGAVERIVLGIEDITQRKLDEEALRKSRALLADRAIQLEQLVAERTASLQETIAELEHFSYTITHDMRAPLRAMQGFGNLLLDRASGEQSPNNAYLKRIVDAARRMDALIQDSLQYAKAIREKLPLTSVEPAPVLRGVLESYTALQASHAEIQIVEPLPPVVANEAGLAQCFSNLLANAVKFVKPDKVPQVRVWAENCGDFVRLWFEDNGIGVPVEYHERIFDMFQQLDKSYDGTGIGLALVRKTAERMGGKVGVESQAGNGSRFWLDLKRAQI